MARIEVENAWVEFPVRLTAYHDLGTSRTGGVIDTKRGTVVALRDISFHLRDGDRLGIMGHNGAGKTTLLRLLCGGYPPSRGRTRTIGSISTLFNTTPGLNPEGTGRENIVTCGLHLGLTRKQIKAKLDEIIDFAELGDFVDLPARIYSAGMMTRLGFSIATAVEPEILLIDEGLATGDAHFAKKAEAKMQELFTRSSILVVASHSAAFLAKMCNYSILLEHGVLKASGPTKELYEGYRNSIVEAARSDAEGGLEMAYSFALDMMKRGEKPPLELEEQAIRYAMSLGPVPRQQLQRYTTVLTQLGKRIEPDLEARLHLAMVDDGSEGEQTRIRLAKILEKHADELTEETLGRAREAVRQSSDAA